MTVPEEEWGACWIDLTEESNVAQDDFCGHHPLWQEIARREAAAKLDRPADQCENCGLPKGAGKLRSTATGSD